MKKILVLAMAMLSSSLLASAAKADLPAGIYRNIYTGAIYYSNGEYHYCQYYNIEDYHASGGIDGNWTNIADDPVDMYFDGYCQVYYPQPVPRPYPVPAPRPYPVPAPRPYPVPRPAPRPYPVPAPRPYPVPRPAPRPYPVPVPRPAPRPMPVPRPAPRPMPAPRPAPRPMPAPRPPAPRPMPAPRPVPRPGPHHFDGSDATDTSMSDSTN